MKIIIRCTFLLFFTFSFSQNFSYGPIVGGKGALTYITSNTSLEGGADRIALNLGFFGDYQLDESFGIKADLIFNIVKEYSYNDRRIGQFEINRLFDDANFTSLQLNLFFKYDVNKEYNKGFYGLAGVSYTNILSIDYQNDNPNDIEINNFYKKPSLGLLLGFGTSIGRRFNYEVVFQYGLTDLILEQSKTDYFELSMNFSYNLSK